MMCLSHVYKGKEKKEALAKLPEMVKCWKVVRRLREQYWPPIFDSQPYRAGWNVTKPRRCHLRYKVAFHAFLNKKEAENWANKGFGQKVIQSKTEKKDIVAIGEQNNRLTIVTKRIWIPKPKKKKKIA